MNWPNWSLGGALVINVYLLGVMVMFASVVYPLFATVRPEAFGALYQRFTSSIGVPVVAWEFVALLVTVLLYLARPESMPSSVVHVLVGLTVVYFAITFGWHLPAHRALAANDNSSAALQPLLASQWVRTVVQLMKVVVLGWYCVGAMR